LPTLTRFTVLHLRVALLGWPHDDAAESGRLATDLMDRLPKDSADAEARPLYERAGLLLADAGPRQFAKQSPGGDCVTAVRERLEALAFKSQLAITDKQSAASALGLLGDPRPGVGTVVVPASAGAADRLKGGQLTELPEIDWLDLPGGTFELGKKPGEPVTVGQFRISKYPVTVAQFEAFLRAPDGYHHERCWKRKDVPKMLDWWRQNHEQGPQDYDPVFQTPNHPRVGVCWFEAIAFTQWLNATFSARELGLPDSKWETRLPTDLEWERVAYGEDGCNIYPWNWRDNAEPRDRCNCIATGIGSTSAVGLFPTGNAECGAADLSGNVWEMCQMAYRNDLSSGIVLRGGSWFDSSNNVRTSYQEGFLPSERRRNVGFRVVASPLPSSASESENRTRKSRGRSGPQTKTGTGIAFSPTQARSHRTRRGFTRTDSPSPVQESRHTG